MSHPPDLTITRERDPAARLASRPARAVHFQLNIPTDLLFGTGRFREAAPAARRLGRRALVVTTKSALEIRGTARNLVDSLETHGVHAAVFTDFQPGPTTDDVDRGAEIARMFRADMVLALGGGSTIDCAKAVAAVAAEACPAARYLHQKSQPGRHTLPIIAIPTTAGTGSELNRSCIITDPERRFKGGIRSDFLFPKIALVDPLLSHSAGHALTAQTGFDALAHAIESYVSPKSNPVCDALALRAISDVVEFLPLALKNPENETARERLALAATTMGINLSSVGTCLPHRLDKPLSALHPHLAHGQAIALFYPAWLRRSIPGNPSRFAKIAALLDPALEGLSTDDRAAAIPDIMASFISGIGLETSMSGVGVTRADMRGLAENTEGDLRINPVPFDRDMLPGFLAEVFSGQPKPDSL